MRLFNGGGEVPSKHSDLAWVGVRPHGSVESFIIASGSGLPGSGWFFVFKDKATFRPTLGEA